MLIKLHSFYSKLSFIFLILVLLLGSGVVAIAFTSSGHLFDKVEQTINREYAGSIASELQPFLKDGFSEERVKNAIHYMMVLNPMVEIYLTDSHGKILAYFTKPGDEVIKEIIDLEPIYKFIDEKVELPISGDDPRSGNSKKPFSAARLQMGTEKGVVYVILRGENYDRSVNSLSSGYYLRTGISTFIFAIVVTLILGFLLFFILTKRLRDLNSAVLEFKNGNYDSRVDIKGSDELSFLGQTFNQMAESIKIGIEKLKIADKQKSDLITNISHDLRSPLTSIRGHLETVILKDANLTSEERTKFLTTALKNIFNFQTLIDNLFELIKLESNQVIVKKETFQLAELVQDIVIKLKPQAEKSGIDLTMNLLSELPGLKGDIAMIERALSNLIENALKYSPAKNEVVISVEKEYQNIIITITDSGYGISEKELSHIFERFYRGEQENKKSITGTGLGLSIVKEIITLHKGRIEVFSTINSGTTFKIYLPY